MMGYDGFLNHINKNKLGKNQMYNLNWDDLPESVRYELLDVTLDNMVLETELISNYPWRNLNWLGMK